MKLLLRNDQAPGDVLMLTAAVRDLHLAHPGRFQTAVQTTAMPLWENNPWVTPAERLGRPDRVIDCGYPLVRESNHRPYHFIHGFAQDLERQLGIHIPLTAFHGDLHLSPEERDAPFPLLEFGHGGPYWVIIAGGKHDFTAKWWNPAYAQAVIDHFAGKIQFVQCGEAGHWHPPLRNVINLVGRTTLRQFIGVIHHADGVVCPVSFPMHLAAALPPRKGPPTPLFKPCVVIAGGREPPHWEMYPHHQFLHTVGALDCCADGGCWKSRCQPVGDGDPKDLDLCAHPIDVGDGLLIPRCMQMITPQRVIHAVETYYEGGVLRYDGTESDPAVSPSEIRVEPRGVAVTIGIGDEYVELAHLAAREIQKHTGLETVVLDQADLAASGLEHPTFLKFRLFDLVDARNILFFDADTVCLEAWRPQEHFGGEAIVCVRERMIPHILDEARRWGIRPEEYFNTGMFIISREHHRKWLRLAESLRHSMPTSFHEQTPLNAARSRLGIPLKFLDRRHNWLGFGGSNLSLDMPVRLAHGLAPGRRDMNIAYCKGQASLFAPTIELNEAEARKLAGRSFVFLDGSGQRCVITLREDGTILPPGDPEGIGYWFAHDVRNRPTLALASETRVLHQFMRGLKGVWVIGEAADPERDGPRLIDAQIGVDCELNEENARWVADEFVRHIPAYPQGRYRGRGIVICGGGERYFPSAWVCIRMLRHLGCDLPIDLWQLDPSELDEASRAMVEEYGVRCRAACDVEGGSAVRNGWALKPFALIHSRFEQVLLLDADNVPVRNPAYLFEEPEFGRTGAIFWPDYTPMGLDRAIWRICKLSPHDQPEFESGQVLVNKSRCWRALQLTMHMNERSDFYYSYVYGDKDTYHMAWLMLNQEYTLVPWRIAPLPGTMCQHDLQGRRLFQHRNQAKWTMRENRRIEGFLYEDLCLGFLDELAERRSARDTNPPPASRPLRDRV